MTVEVSSSVSCEHTEEEEEKRCSLGRDGPLWPAHEEEVRGNKIREEEKNNRWARPMRLGKIEKRWVAHRKNRGCVGLGNSSHSLTRRK